APRPRAESALFLQPDRDRDRRGADRAHVPARRYGAGRQRAARGRKPNRPLRRDGLRELDSRELYRRPPRSLQGGTRRRRPRPPRAERSFRRGRGSREARRELYAAGGRRSARERARGERPMIPEFGNFALILALCLALAQAVLPLAGATVGNRHWMALARPAAAGQFVFCAMAFGALAYAFLTNDFSVRFVALHSNTALPTFYK